MAEPVLSDDERVSIVANKLLDVLNASGESPDITGSALLTAAVAVLMTQCREVNEPLTEREAWLALSELCDMVANDG